MGVAPHNPLGPVANAVALHFDLSTPNFLIQEDMTTDVPWRWEVVQHSLEAKNGYWLPTEVPGLGIEVDESAAAKHPFQQEVLHATTVRAHDGSVAPRLVDLRSGQSALPELSGQVVEGKPQSRVATNSRRRSSNNSPSIVVPQQSGGFSHGL